VWVPIQSVEVIPQFDHELQTPNPVYTNNHESFDNPHDCEPAAFQSAGFERCVGSANCERHVWPAGCERSTLHLNPLLADPLLSNATLDPLTVKTCAGPADIAGSCGSTQSPRCSFFSRQPHLQCSARSVQSRPEP
jgi:hypothetical protein